METAIVRVPYKTGAYIGEKIEEKNDKSLIKVREVLKHPKQGDLHNPNQVDVAMFHERKALAEFEKVWIPTAMVKEAELSGRSYNETLKQAYNTYFQELENKETSFDKKSLETLQKAAEDYKF
ncbi:kinase-associated lipoprotein B [Sinobaca sp. H24]|uniref:kinase-associated lipoprotein B n=1 Tax=Sinobaca sp. H24 TaxID=2923376 RepID=UPI002079E4BC|nr:kinase-associated lipoprotein B [Sinobaca sp. H24]